MPVPKTIEWARPRPPKAGLVWDVVLGLVVAAIGVLGVELYRGMGVVQDLGLANVEVYLLCAVVALPLVVRRRYPTTAMIVASVLFVFAGERAEIVAGSNLATQAALFMAIYSANAWAPRRQRLLVVDTVVIVGMFAWSVYGYATLDRSQLPTNPDDDGLFSPYTSYLLLTSVINIVYFFGALFWGQTAWRIARQRAELERQAVELAAQQEANARRAVIDERLRISRELHDVVAHHISSIGVQAGGARRVLDRDPAASKEALAVIEQSSRQAVNEMRQLLGMLRAADPELDEEVGTPANKAPQAGVDRLPGLVAEANGDQLSVGYHQIGTPAKLPETVSVSVYRIVQEALTNVRRHSTARFAHVTLRYIGGGSRTGAVEIEVIDDGRPKHAPVGSRLGHVGIRERVALLGGETEIGPRPVGGFRVRARFPLKPPIPDLTDASESIKAEPLKEGT